jgi:hypothetical protein
MHPSLTVSFPLNENDIAYSTTNMHEANFRTHFVPLKKSMRLGDVLPFLCRNWKYIQIEKIISCGGQLCSPEYHKNAGKFLCVDRNYLLAQLHQNHNYCSPISLNQFGMMDKLFFAFF